MSACLMLCCARSRSSCSRELKKGDEEAERRKGDECDEVLLLLASKGER
jgi:hypothetical protein